MVVREFLIFGGHVTRELLYGKTLFQAHIVEQHKSYGTVVELWKSVQRNQNFTTFCARYFFELLRIACTKAITAELMDVSRLWDLNEQKVKELLYLLVFLEL